VGCPLLALNNHLGARNRGPPNHLPKAASSAPPPPPRPPHPKPPYLLRADAAGEHRLIGLHPRVLKSVALVTAGGWVGWSGWSGGGVGEGAGGKGAKQRAAYVRFDASGGWLIDTEGLAR